MSPIRTLSLLAALAGALPALTLSAPAAQAAQAAQAGGHHRTALPRILVLATGGTISGKTSARSAIGYDAGAVTGQELIAGVPGVDRLARLQVEQVSNIASQNMNHQVWFKLAARIHQAFARHEADGVVITHGTDTMEETAFFLDNVLDETQPVVLTGAMRPSTAISADGPANMYEAVKVAASAAAGRRGVMLVLNDEIQSARGASKMNTTALQTFHSPTLGPVGYVDAASVRFTSPASPHAHLPLPASGTLPQVQVVYGHADMDARQIDDAVRDGARGIVIAGMGDGNVSAEALAGLARARQAGLVVVRATRVGSGFVNRNVEVNDDQYGLVAAMDLNPQKARILLQLLLASGQTDPAAIQQAFLLNH